MHTGHNRRLRLPVGHPAGGLGGDRVRRLLAMLELLHRSIYRVLIQWWIQTFEFRVFSRAVVRGKLFSVTVFVTWGVRRLSLTRTGVSSM